VNLLKKTIFVTSFKKKEIISIIFFLISIAILDVLSLSLISPLILSLLSENSFNFNFLNFIELDDISENNDFFFYVSFFLILIFFLRSSLTIYFKYLVIKFNLYLRVDLQSRLIKSYLETDYTKFLVKSGAGYLETIVNLVARFSNNLTSIITIIADLVILVFIWGFLLMNSFEITIIITLFLLLLALIYDLLFKKKLKKYGENSSEGSKKLMQVITETVRGFKEIKILQKENFFINQTNFNAKQIANNLSKLGLVTISPRYIFEFIFLLLMITFFIISKVNNLVSDDVVSLLSVFSLAILRILPSITSIISQISSIRFGRHATDTIYNDLLNFEESNSVKKIKQKNLDKKEINFHKLEIKNISYKYPTRDTEIFKNFSLEINKGEFLGITGSSGSGKTTLIDIMVGLIKPTEGDILVDGKKMQDQVSDWQSTIAYIPQNVLLINDTIKKNIALGIPEEEIDQNKINISIKNSSLNEFIDMLSNKENTLIGDNGVQISGGQKQRIALARAFYFDKEVIILDESTNALDKNTENQILKELKNLEKIKTLIFISHDENFLKMCKKIIKLQND
jgi:ATP-binding cassette, subfamily B, bacterial PglK